MSAIPSEKSLADNMLSYERPVRREHQTNFPFVFEGQRIDDYEAQRRVLSMVLPVSWDESRSMECLSCTMSVILASIINYDESLALENEEDSDTGAGISEGYLSVLIAKANQATLSPQHYTVIHEFFGDLVGNMSLLRREIGDRLGHITEEDLKQLCKHLYELTEEKMTLLVDWTRAHCAPKLKWEQYTPFRGSGEGLLALERFQFG